MIGKPPRYKINKIWPAPYLKNIKGEPEKTFFMKPRHSKVNSTALRQFGTDITNLTNNNFIWPQKHSFGPNDTQKVKVYIKKNTSVNWMNKPNGVLKTKTNKSTISTTSFAVKRNYLASSNYTKEITVANSGWITTKAKTLRTSKTNQVGNLRNSAAILDKVKYHNSFHSKSASNNINNDLIAVSGSLPKTQYNRLAENKRVSPHVSNFEAKEKNNIKQNNVSTINKTNNELLLNRMKNQKLGRNKLKPQYQQQHDIIDSGAQLINNIKNISIPVNQRSPSESIPIISPSSYLNNDHQGTKDDKNIPHKKENEYFNTTPSNPNSQIPYEYINDIYRNLLLEERLGIVPKLNPSYMKNQNEINEKMRSILVDWIIDVHWKFDFTDETLFMTISIIDRYLSFTQVTRSNLQLLGITALMISCKHEEIDVPKIEDFIYITDCAYQREDVFKMENDILHQLNFALLHPSPVKFFELLSNGFEFDKSRLMMGKYLVEAFLLDIKSLKYKSSVISCASAYIVMKFFKMENYSESYNRKYYWIGNELNDNSAISIKECAKDICLFVDNIQKSGYTAIYKKYSKKEYEGVAARITKSKS